MNKVTLMGRLTAAPEVRYIPGENSTAIARYTLAVDRRFKKEGDTSADFIRCVAFGKQADFAEKWLEKGTKICICGRIQTGSYTNRPMWLWKNIISVRARQQEWGLILLLRNRDMWMMMDL